MSTITTMENIIAEHDNAVCSDEEVDIQEEPKFSEVSSEFDLSQDTEPTSDFPESELTSDEEEPQFPTI